MDYRELPAPPPLSSVVRCFWFLSGREPDAVPQTIVPDGRLEVVLHAADPFLRLDLGGSPRQQPVALVSGQLTAPIRLMAGAAVDVVGIRFRTAAARVVLRTDVAELTDHVGALSALDPDLERALLAAVGRHRSPEARVSALSAALCARIQRPPDALESALVTALDSPSAPTVQAVADAFRVSARTIERRVTAASGLPPSTLRRVLRFRRAFRLLDQAPAGTWATVAAGAGYYDQAHLIRDFRQFAGAAPSVFLADSADLARAILAGGG